MPKREHHIRITAYPRKHIDPKELAKLLIRQARSELGRDKPQKQ